MHVSVCYVDMKMGAFGSKKTTKELLRENKRTITKAIRELDRERSKMEQEEKKCIADIKKHAKLQQMVLQSRLHNLHLRFHNKFAKQNSFRRMSWQSRLRTSLKRAIS